MEYGGVRHQDYVLLTRVVFADLTSGEFLRVRDEGDKVVMTYKNVQNTPINELKELNVVSGSLGKCCLITRVCLSQKKMHIKNYIGQSMSLMAVRFVLIVDMILVNTTKLNNQQEIFYGVSSSEVVTQSGSVIWWASKFNLGTGVVICGVDRSRLLKNGVLLIVLN